MTARTRTIWTFVITSVALFMTSLDNLVVTTALPVIRLHLHASLSSLEWTVNAYTLTFAVLLLTGATLGERFGRRRMFLVGLVVFTAGSAAAALAPSAGWLIVARAVQGSGSAIVTPLTLTLLSAAVPVERRGAALGAWGAVAGLAISSGPLVGGAVVQGWSWQTIFWINVPIGLLLLPVAWRGLAESHGPASRLDLGGVLLASTGLFGLVLGTVRANALGWTSTYVLTSLAVGAALLVAFVRWELRTSEPMLPMRLFRSRGFTAANAASVLMFFGMFGSIFLLSQALQTMQGYTPLGAGLRMLPWTGMPIVFAPIAGILADRIGARPVVFVGLALQAIGLFWLAQLMSPTTPFLHLVPALSVSGIGMAMFFAPTAALVLSTVRREEEGIASGAANALREVGGVFGVAVLASVFAGHGGYLSPHDFALGLRPAVEVGAAVVGVAALVLLGVPRRATALQAGIETGEGDVTGVPSGELASVGV
ncbi:MAG TPA: DHA2 family efflux MFS transporter permease subunit [Mycobacteriales bacterium]|nr:DHA2 family efflux MFS transporter permease subunit [Mycobacteriales bacterium]